MKTDNREIAKVMEARDKVVALDRVVAAAWNVICANCGTRLTANTVFAPCRDCSEIRHP